MGSSELETPSPTQQAGSFEKIGFILYLLGFVFALWGVAPRWAAEAKNESTEILLDAPALAEWATALSIPRSELEKRLKTTGVNSLAFSELHLDELVDRGMLVAQSGSEFRLTVKSGALGELDPSEQTELLESINQTPNATYLVFRDGQLASDLKNQLTILYGDGVREALGGRVIVVPIARRDLRSSGMGFEFAAIRKAAESGFMIWLRPENRAGFDAVTLEKLFSLWGTLPAVQGVVFGGGPNEAVGFPVNLEVTTEQLKKLGWKVGYIELSPKAQQKGIETLVRSLPELTVRVMAVSPLHQAKLAPFRVLGMYSLGARERNLRVLYVRPYAVPGRPELDEEFLFSLSQELEKAGPASVFEEGGTPAPGLLLTSVLGFCGALVGLLILIQLGLAPRVWWWGFPLLPVILGVGASLIGKAVLFRSLLALAVSVAVPTYTFLRFVYPLLLAPGQHRSLLTGLKVLLICSLLSVTAGIYLAALCSDTTFLLGLDRFRGVKLLTLGAPLLILLCFVVKRYTPKQWLSGLQAQIVIYHALIGGGLLLVLGLLYLRSGNQAGGTATDTERTLRVVLDRVLGVRPRFKEFMVAHPALVCLPLFCSMTGFLPSLVLVLLAGIGQAGIIDTFAHVHTPLDVTLIRVFLGVAFGGVVGGLLMSVAKLVEPRVAKVWNDYKNIS